MRSKGKSGLIFHSELSNRIGVWCFKMKEDSSWELGKSRYFINKCLSCYAKTMGRREEFEQVGPSKLTIAYHNQNMFFVVMSGDSSLPRLSPLSKFLQAVKW